MHEDNSRLNFFLNVCWECPTSLKFQASGSKEFTTFDLYSTVSIRHCCFVLVERRFCKDETLRKKQVKFINKHLKMYKQITNLFNFVARYRDGPFML